ncbi:MAG: GNAT family N-acetyltransferase [Ilumatobacter sp.]|uniref:GNAT family N-acetyltransferase n=1 Tax=Ilumatobacter sp. TaxID=1967498 RepID=UPI003C78E820
MTPDITIGDITAVDTHDLRRRVLRDGAADAVVEWVGDDEPATVHLGATAGGQIVAISTWLDAPDPLVPDVRSRQLRGMATDPTRTGRGLGRMLLTTGLQRATAEDFDRVWANARVTALGFYESAGWTVTGPVFETAVTGLAHRHVHVDL